MSCSGAFSELGEADIEAIPNVQELLEVLRAKALVSAVAKRKLRLDSAEVVSESTANRGESGLFPCEHIRPTKKERRNQRKREREREREREKLKSGLATANDKATFLYIYIY